MNESTNNNSFIGGGGKVVVVRVEIIKEQKSLQRK